MSLSRLTTRALPDSDKLLYLDICGSSDLPSRFASILWLNLDQRIKCALKSFIYIVLFMGNDNIVPFSPYDDVICIEALWSVSELRGCFS